jgi:CRISP-associated protein Cas1
MADQRVLLVESPCHISVDTGRILLKRADGQSKTELASDLAVLCLHHEQITISHHALRALHQANCAVMTTDAQHLPCGVLHPLSGQATSVAVTRLRQQIALDGDVVRKGVLWQHIVAQKIANGAHLLRLLEINGAMRMERLAHEVQPADSRNAEGQAAKHYWQQYFALPQLNNYAQRRQKQDAGDTVNVRLNYGYAVLRAMIARELIVAGLNPILGIGHDNQGNPYNLADDFIEPFRFIVEWAVAQENDFETPFVGAAKQRLLQAMQCEITLTHDTDNQYRLAQAVAQTVKSYCHALGEPNKIPKLKLPKTLFEV